MDDIAKVKDNEQPSLHLNGGSRKLAKSNLTFDNATGDVFKGTLQSEDPNEGDLFAAESKLTKNSLKVTRCVPVSGEAKVAEFGAGWTMPINGQWLKTSEGTGGVSVQPDDSSAMGLILGIIGGLAAIAIAILIYCFCCKSD